MFQLVNWSGWMRPARTAVLYSISCWCWRWIDSITFSISGEGFSLCIKNPVRFIKLTPVQLLPSRLHTHRRYHRMNHGCMHRSRTPHACCSKCPWHDRDRSWSLTHPRSGKRFRRSFRSCPYYRGCERQCERQCATRSIVHGRLNQFVLHNLTEFCINSVHNC